MKIRGFEKVTRIKEKISIPTRSTKHSAGYDFFLLEDVILNAKQKTKIFTGIKVYMQSDELLEIYIRSSLGILGLVLKNGVGIIDSDYYNNEKNEGEIILFLENISEENIFLKKNDKIVQGIFKKYLLADDEEKITIKRNGGFGSTN